MALVILRTPPLEREQKLRIGERVLQALHAEGVSASQVVVRFEVEEADLYLEGGLFVEGSRATPSLHALEAPSTLTMPSDVAMTTGRRPRTLERAAHRERLIEVLRRERSLTSFQAQSALGLRDDPGAAAFVRDLFKGLEEEGLVRKEGQRRGTRYFWSGPEDPSPLPAPILVKREAEGEMNTAEDQDG